MKCSLLTLSCALDGELSKERQADLDAHLVTCERCRTGMRYLREEAERISQLVQVALPEETAVALLERSRVLSSSSPPVILAAPPEDRTRADQAGPALGAAGVASAFLDQTSVPPVEPTIPSREAERPRLPTPPAAIQPEPELENQVPEDQADQELSDDSWTEPEAAGDDLSADDDLPGQALVAADVEDGHTEIADPPVGCEDKSPPEAAGDDLSADDDLPGQALAAAGVEDSQTEIADPPVGWEDESPPEAAGDDLSADDDLPGQALVAADVEDSQTEIAYPPVRWEDESPPAETAEVPDVVLPVLPMLPELVLPGEEFLEPAAAEETPVTQDPAPSPPEPVAPSPASTAPGPATPPVPPWQPSSELRIPWGEESWLDPKPGAPAAGSGSAAPFVPPPPSAFSSPPTSRPIGFTPRRPADTVASEMGPTARPRLTAATTPAAGQRRPPRGGGRGSAVTAGAGAGSPGAPRDWTRIGTIAVGAVAVVLILFGVLHHGGGSPAAAGHPGSRPTSSASAKPKSVKSPASHPTAAPTPIALTGVQTIGTSGSGYQVQTARYGLHPGPSYWVVFQLVSGSGAPKVTYGFDGTQKLYVEMPGVASGATVPQPPSGNLVTSVTPGQMPGFTGAVYILQLSQSAQVQGYLIPGNGLGGSGERVLLEVQ